MAWGLDDAEPQPVPSSFSSRFSLLLSCTRLLVACGSPTPQAVWSGSSLHYHTNSRSIQDPFTYTSVPFRFSVVTTRTFSSTNIKLLWLSRSSLPYPQASSNRRCGFRPVGTTLVSMHHSPFSRYSTLLISFHVAHCTPHDKLVQYPTSTSTNIGTTTPINDAPSGST